MKSLNTKKIILATLITTALMGCDDSSVSEDLEAIGIYEGRNLDVGVDSLVSKDEISIQNFEHQGFNHYVITEGYTVSVTDEIQDDVIVLGDIDLERGEATGIEVFGAGEATLSTDRYAGYASSSYYTVSGTTTFTENDDSIRLEGVNTQWAYVTVTDTSIISNPTITYYGSSLEGGSTKQSSEMVVNNVQDGYYVAYVKTVLEGAWVLSFDNTETGETVEIEMSKPKLDTHYKYTINESYEQGVTIALGELSWSAPQEVCIYNCA